MQSFFSNLNILKSNVFLLKLLYEVYSRPIVMADLVEFIEYPNLYLKGLF